MSIVDGDNLPIRYLFKEYCSRKAYIIFRKNHEMRFVGMLSPKSHIGMLFALSYFSNCLKWSESGINHFNLRQKNCRPLYCDSSYKGDVNMTEERVVVFQIDEDEYAIRIGDAKEIIQYPANTKLPNTLDFRGGFIDIHGQTIPVISLSAKFGMADDRPGERWVMIVEIGSREIGIFINGITEVGYLSVANIEPTYGVSDGPGSCIRGFGKIGNRLIILLNPVQVFTDNELGASKAVV